MRWLALSLAAALLGFLWTLGWIALAHLRFHAFHRRRGLAYPPLGGRGWLRFYARTLGSIARLTLWGARAPLAGGLRSPRGGATGPPVLCVHGFHMNGTCMWGIRRRLERSGRATSAVFLGLPYRPAAAYGPPLARALEALAARAPEGRIDVVAHSMGGLVLRDVLGRRPDLARAVRRIVTLGTPHHGTALLAWFRFGPVWEAMRIGSPYLARLPDFAASAPGAEVWTLASQHDLVVYPLETAFLGGARQVTFRGIGHLGLLTEPAVLDRVAGALDGVGGGILSAGGADGDPDRPTGGEASEG